MSAFISDDERIYVIAHKYRKSTFIGRLTENFLSNMANESPEIVYDLFNAYTFAYAANAVSFIDKYDYLKKDWQVCKVKITLTRVN